MLIQEWHAAVLTLLSYVSRGIEQELKPNIGRVSYTRNLKRIYMTKLKFRIPYELFLVDLLGLATSSSKIPRTAPRFGSDRLLLYLKFIVREGTRK
jgi:hypothetical protein